MGGPQVVGVTVPLVSGQVSSHSDFLCPVHGREMLANTVGGGVILAKPVRSR